MELELRGTIKTKHYNSVENGYDENITFCNEKGEYIVDKDLYGYTLNYPNFNAEFGSEQYILDLIKLDFI